MRDRRMIFASQSTLCDFFYFDFLLFFCVGGLTVATILCTSDFGRWTTPRIAVFKRSKPGLVSKVLLMC